MKERCFAAYLCGENVFIFYVNYFFSLRLGVFSGLRKIFPAGLAIIFLLLLNSCSTDSEKNKRLVRQDTLYGPVPGKPAMEKFRIDPALISSFLQSHPEFFKDSTLVRRFYRHRNFQAAWLDSDGFISKTFSFFLLFEKHLAEHPEDSLVLNALKSEVNRLKDSAAFHLNTATILKTDLLLSAGYFYFARKEYNGYGTPVRFALDWNIPREGINYDEWLDSLLSASDEHSFRSEPVYFMYGKLRDQLIAYQKLTREESWEPLVCDSGKIRPGDRSALLPGIKHRLFLLGDLGGADSTDRADDALVTAVRRYQERMGLSPDGVIGKEFMESINIPLEQRLRQIRMNMERCRWLPSRIPEPYIEINLPEFRIRFFEGDTTMWTCKAIVGKPGSMTSIFKGNLEYVVFSPYWNIPLSILEGELLADIRNDPEYLVRRQMQVVNDKIPPEIIDPKTIDWTTMTAQNFPYTIRQKPGASNSLGWVKFLFPNKYSIYMHDTPEKRLFEKPKRAFSHGCIRISEPEKMASFLLKGDTAWTQERIKEVMYGGKEKYVKIKKEIPVFVVYLTAWVDENGLLNFRDDVYGYDERLGEVMF